MTALALTKDTKYTLEPFSENDDESKFQRPRFFHGTGKTNPSDLTLERYDKKSDNSVKPRFLYSKIQPIAIESVIRELSRRDLWENKLSENPGRQQKQLL